MLRNIYYDPRKSVIHHWLFDENGEPVYRKEYFKPYLYIKSVNPKKVDAIGVDDLPLEKKEFMNDWERRNYLKAFKGKVYFNLPPTQQYLLGKYYTYDIQELTANPLRIFFYDIEVIADEFPEPREAKYPITAITIYDSYTKKYMVWGVKPYDDYSCKDHLKDVEPDEIIYSYCKDEKILLKAFITYWRRNFPDVVVGYNSFSFDLPYIVHRLEQVFGEGYSAKLSPVECIKGTEQQTRYGNSYMEYTLGGIAHLDYLILYKLFTPGERESDSLDFVCSEELHMGKLDYGDMSLKDLCEKDWNKFINYNIWDVKLLVMLDNYKRYLEIAKFSAFSGFCNLDKAQGKTSIIAGVLAKQALMKGKIIPTQTQGEEGRIPGGFVKQPDKAMREDIVSFDANSLYPSTIITLNISPETKMAKIVEETEDRYRLYFFTKDTYSYLDKSKLPEFLKRSGYSMSACGIFFSQKEMSVSASFCDELYQKRKKVRKEVEILEKKLESMDKSSDEYKAMRRMADQKDTEQYLYKILLNSTYGAFANRFFALYDLDCAKSITTTGQAMIKKTEQIINDYIVKEWDLPEKDRVVGIDTDSNLITIEDIRKKMNFELVDANGDLTPEFVEVETKLSNHINSEIDLWARETWNSRDPRFFFKRESVCPRAIWTGKKHYILHLLNKEGKKMNKFKYTGLSVAKSTWSMPVKQMVKRIVEQAIMTAKDNNKANQMLFDIFNNDFKNLPVNDIAERSSIKVLDKWEDKNNEMKVASGTTRAAKWIIWHNELLKKLDLVNKYRKIENGSKIKMAIVKDNVYNIPGIAYQDMLPPEFNLEVDYDAHFFKGVLKSIEPIYEAVGWKLPNPKKQVELSLEELFG